MGTARTANCLSGFDCGRALTWQGREILCGSRTFYFGGLFLSFPSLPLCTKQRPRSLFFRARLNDGVAMHAQQGGRTPLGVRHLPEEVLDAVHDASAPHHPQPALPEAPVRLLPAPLQLAGQPALAHPGGAWHQPPAAPQPPRHAAPQGCAPPFMSRLHFAQGGQGKFLLSSFRAKYGGSRNVRYWCRQGTCLSGTGFLIRREGS